MHLQDLPPELFQQIVHNIVSSVAIDDAWALRGVSRTFAAAIKYDVLTKQPRKSFPTYRSRQLLERFADTWLFNRINASLDFYDTDLVIFREMITFLAQELQISDQQRQEFTEQFCIGFKRVGNITRILSTCFYPQPVYIVEQSKDVSRSLDTHDKLWASWIIGNYGLIQKLLPKLEPSGSPRFLLFKTLEIAISNDDKTLLDLSLRHLESLLATDPVTPGLFESSSWDRAGLSVKHAICTAIRKDSLDITQALLAFYAKNFPPAPPNTWNMWFETAVVCGRASSAKPNMNDFLTVVLGYESEKKSRVSRSSLKHVFKYGTRAMIDEVLSHWTVDINTGTALTLPLCIAVRAGSQDAVNTLLDAGADVNITFASNRRSTPKTRESPIDLAIHDHDLRITNLLISRGATIPHSSDWPTHKKTYDLLRQIVREKKNVRLPHSSFFKRMRLADRKELEA